jgi:ATP-binding cassette subfamily C protein
VLKTLKESVQVLDHKGKQSFIFFSLVQAVLSVLDLFGILLVGAIGALGIRGLSGAGNGDRVAQLLDFLGLGNLSLTLQISILGGIATSLLTSKTFLSALITRKTYHLLSESCANLTTNLLKKISTQPRDKLNSKSSQEVLYTVSDSARTIVVTMLGAGTLLLSDITLIIILYTGLAFLNFQVAILSLIYFSGVATIVYVLLQRNILNLGSKVTQHQIETNQEILEMLIASKEIKVSGKSQFYLQSVRLKQGILLRTVADFSFVPLLAKYIIEGSIVFGAVLLGYLEFQFQDPYHAVASLSVFIAAGTRMAPALLRIQNGALIIKGSKGATSSTFELIKEIESQTISNSPIEELNHIAPSNFSPIIKFQDVSFTYFGESKSAISKLNLEIPVGAKVAIVGASGSGKSTILDLLLGILDPTEGKISISELNPTEAIAFFPGKIAYVPQQVSVFNKSLRENMVIGVSPLDIDEKRLIECARISDLDGMVNELVNGFDTVIQESGHNISGGQKQRIGIARALYSNPSLMVFDEATSALDVMGELKVLQNLRREHPEGTHIYVTHRIALAEACDFVVYVNEGRVIATGTFSEVKKLVKDLEEQADLSNI